MVHPSRIFTMAALAALTLVLPAELSAQSYYVSFDGSDASAIRLSPDDIYTAEKGYGFDFVHAAPPSLTKQRGLGEQPCFVSFAVPDGNYRVSVTLGHRRHAGSTTLRAESRRLFAENVPTRKGEFVTCTFVVNKRDTHIRTTDSTGTARITDHVRIKKREEGKLNWDDRLTIEISGDAPTVSSIRVEPASDTIPTLWLCGNSTVVDQDYEPWASWGQMIPRWFDDNVAIANYAESGETASTFIAAGRLRKILSLMKAGDYIFIEFGHNDQKQRFAGAGAYYNFAFCLKQFVDEARQRGATPIFVTPTQRRSFADGHIQETHGDYPDAMRQVARRENVPVIELHEMTRTFYETLGEEASKRAFVHYPANTFPGQTTALADNTHFNPYGAYEIAKMVVEGMKQLQLPIIRHLRPDYVAFDPAHPDAAETFHWVASPFTEALKPDGN